MKHIIKSPSSNHQQQDLGNQMAKSFLCNMCRWNFIPTSPKQIQSQCAGTESFLPFPPPLHPTFLPTTYKNIRPHAFLHFSTVWLLSSSRLNSHSREKLGVSKMSSWPHRMKDPHLKRDSSWWRSPQGESGFPSQSPYGVMTPKGGQSMQSFGDSEKQWERRKKKTMNAIKINK